MHSFESRRDLFPPHPPSLSFNSKEVGFHSKGVIGAPLFFFFFSIGGVCTAKVVAKFYELDSHRIMVFRGYIVRAKEEFFTRYLYASEPKVTRVLTSSRNARFLLRPGSIQPPMCVKTVFYKPSQGFVAMVMLWLVLKKFFLQLF